MENDPFVNPLNDSLELSSSIGVVDSTMELEDKRGHYSKLTDELRKSNPSFVNTVPLAKLAAEVEFLNVPVVGHTGAGKSTLVGHITGEETGITSWNPQVLEEPEPHIKEGWRFFDTQGLENWTKREFDRFKSTMLYPQDLGYTPAAIFYCHRANHKFQDEKTTLKFQENEVTFLREGAKIHRPVFFIVTDIFSISTEELQIVTEGTHDLLCRLFCPGKKPFNLVEDDTGTLYRYGDYVYSCFVNTRYKEIQHPVTKKVIARLPLFGCSALLLQMMASVPPTLALTLLESVKYRPFSSKLFSGMHHVLLDASLVFSGDDENKRKEVVEFILASENERVKDTLEQLGALDWLKNWDTFKKGIMTVLTEIATPENMSLAIRLLQKVTPK